MKNAFYWRNDGVKGATLQKSNEYATKFNSTRKSKRSTCKSKEKSYLTVL